MKNKLIITSVLLIGLFQSCSKEHKADGYGNFEATEIIISSEANGKIEFLKLEEGDVLKQAAYIGLVDTLQLHLNKQQLLASEATVASKSGNVWSQINVLNQQLKTAETEKTRIENMFAEKAATQRQVDEISGRVNVIKEQIKNVETQNAPIVNEVKTIRAKIAVVTDQIEKSKIINPIKGTVLTKYAEAGEITSFGKPLYKIADMEQMTLKVYISEPQLPNIKIGQQVTVKIDQGDQMKNYSGTISWISATAEFTPKIIQTKEERVNLVYAVKIIVKNDGSLKIGMPAEMWLPSDNL